MTNSRDGAQLAFVEDIMERLGATAEQTDRERARAHEELLGRPKRRGGRREQPVADPAGRRV